MEISGKRKAFNARIALTATKIILAIAMVIVSAIVLVTSAPTLSNFGAKTNRYLFVIGLSAVFMFEMFLPSIAEKIFRIKISPIISFVFIIHCFGGTFLGNVANMYYAIPYFDKIMHFLVGVNTSMLGLALIQIFYRGEGNNTSPIAAAVFTFFVGVALGACWEVFEFSADVLFNLNMQKYALETGKFFVGQAALMDTMLDIVLDIAGALVVAIPTYVLFKCGKDWHKYCAITKEPETANIEYAETHNEEVFRNAPNESISNYKSDLWQTEVTESAL